MPVDGPRNRIAPIAEDQWGLITRRQALDAGVSQTTLDRLTAEGGDLRRVGYAVYRLVGAPEPDHLGHSEWRDSTRTSDSGMGTRSEKRVVSHRSAAEMYGIGNLPADRHDFTVDRRRQTRQPNIRLHTRPLADHDWIRLRGLPVTLPSRIASDSARPGGSRGGRQRHCRRHSSRLRLPGSFAEALRPHAYRFGLRRGDGLGLLRWFLALVGDPKQPCGYVRRRPTTSRPRPRARLPEQRRDHGWAIRLTGCVPSRPD